MNKLNGNFIQSFNSVNTQLFNFMADVAACMKCEQFKRRFFSDPYNLRLSSGLELTMASTGFSDLTVKVFENAVD